MLGVNYLKIFGITFLLVSLISVSGFYIIDPLFVKRESKGLISESQTLELTFQELANIAPAAGVNEMDELLSWEADGINMPSKIPSVKEKKALEKKKILEKNKTLKERKALEAKLKAMKEKEGPSDIVVNKNVDKKMLELEKRFAKLEKSMKSLKTNLVKKSDVTSLKNVVMGMQKELLNFISRNEKGYVASNNANIKISSWILRSAKKDTAWVSKKGSNKLIALSIGDFLPEIGNVESVAKETSGLWVVRGDKGTIRQK